jgi:hypothetical protein
MLSIVASGVRGKFTSEFGDRGMRVGRVGILNGMSDGECEGDSFLEDELEEWEEKMEPVGDPPGVLRRT